MTAAVRKRGQWKSPWGFVLAAIGSAIGLGNIWRFSYLAYDNGGGAFLIPYLVALFTAGIPLLILEFGIGHERIGSAPLALAKVHPRWEWLGWWPVIFVMFGIVLYYSVIIAWCVDYVFYAVRLSWGADPDAFFFHTFLGASGAPSRIGAVQTPVLAALVGVWCLTWAIIVRGVSRGIELANRIFMPLLLVLTLILVGWSLGLEGAREGIRAYLRPDFSRLAEPKVWISAYGQIFFTLSLGFGIMIAYASYLPHKSDITGSAVVTALANSGFSLLAGFGVFSVLGFMAHSQGVGVEQVVTHSIGLAFVAYPKAISLMGPAGKVFGVLFFLSLVVAGLSSSVSIVEAFTAAVVDKFGTDRRTLAGVLCVIGFVGGLIFTTQGGLYWIDIVDHFLNAYGLVVVGLLECVAVGWFFRIETIRRHLNRVSRIPLGPWWNWVIKLVLPGILGVILVQQLVEELSRPYGGYSWASLIAIGWNWVLVTLLASFILAMRPWHQEADLRKGRGDGR
ncbi:sodium-dependent transporter [Dissulfurirhabdus thermomarina]|uniref:Sodium-dependent transporter n=1 Tax=Dissulfurirhabdus thermomarina TaxID=1765737 RepID=A0A6N9TM91_DISTH|nr:sodium-dependent transporter [Dissulfurirhabdus thermomarina]NDY42401.1 sodium-dependent transporter [Dissulfurirhabdus thermomarina]NMX23229.1 sodium-dependent transporter [Dissulfurirhabdus thermomarina]